MKTFITVITLISAGIIFSVTTIMASSMSHGSHDQEATTHSGHAGQMIHESTVDGYRLAYHLIDMAEKMKDMNVSAPTQMGTHHLMVYVQSPDGQETKNARVGYLIVGPDNTRQKAMTMAMTSGFGADVSFKAKGTYVVSTKIVVGDRKILDNFNYTVK